MKEEILTETQLRQYLLGKIDDEGRQRIEKLFLTDSHARDRILAAEQDLIEDYLEDSLTTEDEAIFLSQYAQTPEQQRQLRINKSIKDWALREAASTQVIPVKVSAWTQLRERLRLKPAFVVPVVVLAITAIIVAAAWLSNLREQQKRHLAIEQQLAQLNAPASLREVPPGMTPLDLSPVAVRSDEQQREFKKSADTSVVELRLPWIEKERYSAYQAEVRHADEESFTIPNLQAENDDGYRIRVRLPANFVRRGQYRLRLSGIRPDGTHGIAAEYTFAVSE
jgi:hypothetical protein